MSATDIPRQEALLRWRLVLGKGVEGVGGEVGRLFALPGLAGEWGAVPDAGGGTSATHMPGAPEADVIGIDGALEFVYGDLRQDFTGYSLGAAMPHIPRWLADIRRYFPNDVVSVIQKDAVERRGLKQLIFEKETLPRLERNVDLLATIVALRDLIPDATRETARQVVREIAEEIRRQLEPQVRTAVLGALNHSRHSPMPVYRNLDWKRTIQRNLRHYDRERRRLVAERFYFWANQQKVREWQVIICVDQSGSMTCSVVYSSIMASIFASLNALSTHMVLWSTDVLDVTEQLNDPVDILFGPQLGGGTDAPKAIAYCTGLVRQPERTIFVLVSDLDTAGEDAMVSGLRALVESKVRVICLLALTDAGKPSYNHPAAKRVANLGIPTLACTPRRLARSWGDTTGKDLDARATAD